MAPRDANGEFEHGQLDLASIGQRFVAMVLDSILFIAPLFISLLILDAVQPPGYPPSDQSLAVTFFANILLITVGRVVYEGSMLHYRGQTLGKMAMKIKVVTPQGKDLRGEQAWGRSASSFLLGGCLAGVGYVPVLFTEEKTGLHDLLAKTRVIRDLE